MLWSQARWEEFYALHKINFVAFNRDMKRALWQIDDAVIGKTLLEHMFEREAEPDAVPRCSAHGGTLSRMQRCRLTVMTDVSVSVDLSRKRVCRAQLENRFRGSADDWRALSVVNSIQLDKVETRNRH